jgi:hypothetical protein
MDEHSASSRKLTRLGLPHPSRVDGSDCRGAFLRVTFTLPMSTWFETINPVNALAKRATPVVRLSSVDLPVFRGRIIALAGCR